MSVSLWMSIQLQVIQLQLMQLFLLAARHEPHPEYVLLTSSVQLECLFNHSLKVINELGNGHVMKLSIVLNYNAMERTGLI